MFDHMTVTAAERSARGWGSLGVATAGHLAIVLGVLSASYLVVETVTPPDTPIDLVIPDRSHLDRAPRPTPPAPDHGPAGRSLAAPRLGAGRAHPPSSVPALPMPRLTDLPPAVDSEPMGDATRDGTGPEGPGSPSGTRDGEGTDVRGIDLPGPGDGAGGPLALDSGVEPPVLLHKVVPEYPASARTMRLSGRVFVKAVVSPTGDVVDVEVISSTLPLFEDSALEAVKNWKYRPATLRGRPVAVYFTVSVSFTLR